MKGIHTVIGLSYALALATIFFNICTEPVKQCACGVCEVCKRSANMGAIPLAIPLGLVIFFLIAVMVAVMNTLKES